LENREKALPLHPQSGQKGDLRAKMGSFECFLKKVSKKFGSFKNSSYLCIAFRLKK
jgi:hypothetical protein